MSKRDQAVWVLLGVLAFLAAAGSCWLYRWLRIKWLLAHGAAVLHTTNTQIFVGMMLGFLLFFILFAIFSHLYRCQPIWGIPDHHYGRTSVQEEVYPLLGPKREREDYRIARKARKEKDNKDWRWVCLAVFLIVLRLFCFCLVPRDRLMEDGSVRSAHWISVIPADYDHTETDSLRLHLDETEKGGFFCYIILTASGEKFEFSPKDFGDAGTLEAVSSHFPPAEIDRPELLKDCAEEDLAILAPILP